MRGMKKVVAIVGPTATGKTNLGVSLAKTFDGSVISADSRQIYKGLDIGSNKISSEEMQGIHHYGIDCAGPHEPWSVARFQDYGNETLETIFLDHKLPIIVGGSGMYVDSLLFDSSYPPVPPNVELRKNLEEKTVGELFDMLESTDPERAATIDRDNKVRLVRALEIVEALGYVPETSKEEKFDTFWIGLDMEDGDLQKRISQRLDERIAKGLFNEVSQLLRDGVSGEWLRSLGIEYRYGVQCVCDGISKEEACRAILNDSWKLVRKQRTWWRRNGKIRWYSPDQFSQIEKDVSSWYSNGRSV